VAYFTADPDKIKGIFSNPDAFVTAAPFLFLLTCVIVLIFGPGIFSLDALIGRLCGEKKK
jgi:putative oxidoreductase